MKKILLSSFVVGSFLLYSLTQRASGTNASTEPLTSSLSKSGTPSPGITSIPNSSSPNSASSSQKIGQYKDGTYIGDTTDAFYGNVQVKAIIQNGSITDVQFLDYPQDRGRSIMINTYAMPLLKSEAIQTQNAHVDIVSGATATSQAFVESLASALKQAK